MQGAANESSGGKNKLNPNLRSDQMCIHAAEVEKEKHRVALLGNERSPSVVTVPMFFLGSAAS